MAKATKGTRLTQNAINDCPEANGQKGNVKIIAFCLIEKSGESDRIWACSLTQLD